MFDATAVVIVPHSIKRVKRDRLRSRRPCRTQFYYECGRVNIFSHSLQEKVFVCAPDQAMSPNYAGNLNPLEMRCSPGPQNDPLATVAELGVTRGQSAPRKRGHQDSVTTSMNPEEVVGHSGCQCASDNMLALVREHIRSSSKQEDEWDIAGKNVGAKLRRLSEEQRLFAERLIHEVLFQGQLRNLSINSKIVNQPQNEPDVTIREEEIDSKEFISLGEFSEKCE